MIEEKPLSIEEYNKLPPHGQGYISYMRSEWPNWSIPKICPYLLGSEKYHEWKQGEHSAIIDCIDVEE